MSDSYIIFNRERKARQLDRAAAEYNNHDFIQRETAKRLASQFSDIIRKDFPLVLNIGARTGFLSEELRSNNSIGKIFEIDISLKMLEANTSPFPKIQADEEFLPFRNESFDLIVSNLVLHWVNDLPGFLTQAFRILKKGGFFCANIFGGKTLHELHYSMMKVEEKAGKLSPRVSPFIQVRDGATLLQRVKFAEPVSVSEEITVKYSTLDDLMRDLRNTGENNSLSRLNSNYVGKTFFKEAEYIYIKDFSDERGNLNSSFEIITISGWKNL